MRKVSASDAKNRFGALLEEAAQHDGVEIVRHGRVIGVLLSPKAFAELVKGAARDVPPEWGASHMIPPDKARRARILKPPGDFDE